MYIENITKNLFLTVILILSSMSPATVLADKIQPTLDIVSIVSSNSESANLANEGDEVILTLSASEDIKKPKVEFSTDGKKVNDKVQVKKIDSNANTWTATFEVHKNDEPGSISYTIKFEDKAKNDGDTVTNLSAVQIPGLDEIKPTLTILSILSTNSESANLANEGDEVILTFTASEDIKEPKVEFSTDGRKVDDRVQVKKIDSSANTWTATFEVHKNDEPDFISYAIEFKDEANNDGETVIKVSSVEILGPDETAPVIAEYSVKSNNSDDENKALVGDKIIIEFTTSEKIIEPTVSIKSGNQEVNDLVEIIETGELNIWNVSYTVSQDDIFGFITFTIDFEDLAGNEGDTFEGINNLVKVVDGPFVNLDVTEYGDTSLTSVVQEDIDFSLSNNKKLKNADILFEVLANSNSSFDLFIIFSAYELDGVCIPSFTALESSNVVSEVDLITGNLTLELTEDSGKKIRKTDPLITLIGQPGSIIYITENYNQKSKITPTVVCGDDGTGVILLKIQPSDEKSVRFELRGTMLAASGGANKKNGKISSITGEAPAGRYQIDLAFGVKIPEDFEATSADDYLSENTD